MTSFKVSNPFIKGHMACHSFCFIITTLDNHPTNQIRQLEWNPVEITQLQQVDNKFTRVVDL